MSSLVFGVIVVICLSYLSETSAQCPAFMSKRFGGLKGGAFTDKSKANNGDITAIRMECGTHLTAIQFRYGNVWGPKHGWGRSNCGIWWTRGKKVSYNLAPREYISGATISYGDYVNSVRIKTNKRKLPKCGSSKGEKSKSVSGKRLKFVQGRSGCIVDAIQFYWPTW
uniref:Jacalin-related lectin n=1 Tax=Pteria penguin TaxID=113549 RepID=B6F0T5_PTEPN|nr:jacalin-related lectin [Pteria penguin]